MCITRCDLHKGAINHPSPRRAENQRKTPQRLLLETFCTPLEGPDRASLLTHMNIDALEELAPTIEIKTRVLLRRRDEAIGVSTAFGHKVRQNLGDQPTAHTATTHARIDRQHLEVPVEVASINGDLVGALSDVGKILDEAWRGIAEELIPTANETANKSNLAIVHERRCDNTPLMLYDKRMAYPLI